MGGSCKSRIKFHSDNGAQIFFDIKAHQSFSFFPKTTRVETPVIIEEEKQDENAALHLKIKQLKNAFRKKNEKLISIEK